MMLRRSFMFLMAAQDATFTTEVKVVNVLASVRTKTGEIVRDLTRDDFSLIEAGRPQAIRYFTRQSDLPLTIGLMVDTSGSQQKVLEAERTASYHFIDQVLREDRDQVFIMQFDVAVQLRQPLTSSRRKLDEVLPHVDTQTRGELRAQGGGTLLFDAVVKASSEVMKDRTGRKALILLTDGVDVGSEQTIAQAIDAAQKADTLIYSILFSTEGGSGRGGLARMARETGGGFFEVTKKVGIERIFAVIEDELRSQFNIGFVSDQPVVISEFRKLQLAVKQKGLTVQARERYWAKR